MAHALPRSGTVGGGFGGGNCSRVCQVERQLDSVTEGDAVLAAFSSSGVFSDCQIRPARRAAVGGRRRRISAPPGKTLFRHSHSPGIQFLKSENVLAF
jgi:hypothetical protein